MHEHCLDDAVEHYRYLLAERRRHEAARRDLGEQIDLLAYHLHERGVSFRRIGTLCGGVSGATAERRYKRAEGRIMLGSVPRTQRGGRSRRKAAPEATASDHPASGSEAGDAQPSLFEGAGS